MKAIILTATLTVLASITSGEDKAPSKETPVVETVTAAIADPAPAPVQSAEPAAPMVEDWRSNTVSFGAQQTDSDTISSKFMEYRDVPNGVIAPWFRFQGRKGGLLYDFLGENVKQTDQLFRMRLREVKWGLEGDYNRIPHNFGNDGRTILEETGPGVWEVSDTIQNAFQTTLAASARTSRTYSDILALVSPSLAAGNRVDVKLTRERGNLAFIAKPSDPVEFRVTYSRERRTGSRAASGTAFGFGNVVELPEPVHYLTQDFGAEGQYEGTWGILRAGVHVNQFSNRIQSLTFDNPFRITDSTDGSAYTAPGSGSVGGPVFGRMSLPPDNEAFIANASVMFKMKHRTRLSADASLGQWKQNESPFLAYTTNTAIVDPLRASDAGTLPASRLDGKADITSFNLFFTSQPVNDLSLSARYRSYEMDNKTPRLSFPGYVRFDGVWEDIPRISVPYGYKNDQFDATIGYRFGDLSLQAGLKHIKMERTFRETEDTKETGASIAAVLHTSDWLVFRGSYEKASRDFDGLDIEQSEHASYQDAGTPVNLLATEPNTLQTNGQPLCPAGRVCNLRYDQSNKDVERIGAQASLSPSDKVTFSVGYLRTEDDYKESLFGLISAKFDTFSVDLDITASENANLYAFYAYEKLDNFQVGRQSGATVSNNSIDDWTSTVADKTNSGGVGANFTLVPDKWFLNLQGSYQKVNGNNAIFTNPLGAAGRARANVGGTQDIALFDDTEIGTFSAEAKYQFAPDWALSVGGWVEDYKVDDAQSTGVTNYIPASFFLAANDADYTAKVAYVRVTYHW